MHVFVTTRDSRTLPGFYIRPEIQTELIRKSIHMLIAAVPLISTVFSAAFALLLLASGTLLYSYSEHMRHQGITIPIITRITELASRKRDLNRFVLGPITLGLGAMLALMLYPAPAAFMAIYALAFGDGLAGLVGKAIGRIKIPASRGKTLEGSLACFTAVFFAGTFFFTVPEALAIALVATFIEALPTGDADNVLLPVLVGLVATSFHTV